MTPEASSARPARDPRWSQVFDESPMPMTMLWLSDGRLEGNRAFCALVGRGPDDLRISGVRGVIHLADDAELQRSLDESAGRTLERRYLTAQGAVVHALATDTPVRDGTGRVVALLTHVTDISAHRRAAEQALRASELRFSTVVNNISDLLWLVDGAGRISYANPSAARLLGVPADRLVGQAAGDWVHPEDVPRLVAMLGEAPSSAVPTQHPTEFRLVTAEGEHRWVQAVLTDLRGDPTVEGYVVNARDVTTQRAVADRLWQLAHRDPLTGLANRTALLEWLDTRAGDGGRLAVICASVDGIDLVNDSAGFAAGDAVLCRIADRLAGLADATGLVARLDGTQFVLCCPGLDLAAARVLAGRVAEQVSLPVSHDDAEFHLTASAGVVVGHVGERGSALLRDVTAALRRAKRRGRGAIGVFDESLRREVHQRVELAAELRHAVGDAQLTAYYQPVVSLLDGSVIGAEALARWHHPTRGLVPAADFIPIAEDTGLIGSIGMLMLADAAARVTEWRDRRNDLTVSVNVSVQQLSNSRTADLLHEAVAAYIAAGATLTVEITETVLLDDDEHIVSRLEGLRALGAGLSLDDFGTLYSSLTYLRRYPFSVVKIDRSFVAGVPEDRRDRSIVAGVIELAGALGLRVVAEGVETPDQLAFLRSAGADAAQGYLLGRPMPASDFSSLLTDGAALAALVTGSAAP